jgi:hypothetical protein
MITIEHEELTAVCGGLDLGALAHAGNQGLVDGARSGGLAGGSAGAIAGWAVTAPFGHGDKGVWPGATVGATIGAAIGAPVGWARGIASNAAAQWRNR